MKHHTFLLTCLCLPLLVLGGDVETWRSANGHSFEGTFLRFEKDRVQLQGTDGRTITVPITALDAESKARVLELSGDTGIANPLFSHSTPEVDIVFGESPENTYLQIRLKKGGQTIPYYGKIDVHFGATERIYNQKTGKPNQKRVKLKEIITETSDDTRGTFRLKYEKGIETVVTVKKLSNGVEFSYKMDAVPKSVEGPQISSRVGFPAVLEYNKQTKLYEGPFVKEPVPFAELDAMFAQYVATAVQGKRTTTFSFDESPKALSGTTLTLSTPNTKDIEFAAVGKGRVETSFYGGKKMVEGFGVKFNQIRSTEEEPYVYTIQLK